MNRGWLTCNFKMQTRQECQSTDATMTQSVTPPHHSPLKNTLRSLALPLHFKQHYHKSVSVAACTMFHNNTVNSMLTSSIRHNSPIVNTPVSFSEQRIFRTSRITDLLYFRLHCTTMLFECYDVTLIVHTRRTSEPTRAGLPIKNNQPTDHLWSTTCTLWLYSLYLPTCHIPGVVSIPTFRWQRKAVPVYVSNYTSASEIQRSCCYIPIN